MTGRDLCSLRAKRTIGSTGIPRTLRNAYVSSRCECDVVVSAMRYRLFRNLAQISSAIESPCTLSQDILPRGEARHLAIPPQQAPSYPSPDVQNHSLALRL